MDFDNEKNARGAGGNAPKQPRGKMNAGRFGDFEFEGDDWAQPKPQPRVRTRSGGSATARGRKRRKSGAVNYKTVLALAAVLIVLIGIISLAVWGIVSCSGGCAGDVQETPVPQIRPIATPTPEPTATPQPDGNDAIDPGLPQVQNTQSAVYTGGLRSATIRNIGDFVIHEPIFVQAKKLAASTGVSYAYNFAPMLNLIREEMTNADYTVANVDGSMGGAKHYKYGYSGYPQINTPPCLLYALSDSGVDMLTLANNHALDGWFEGLKDTINNVETVNIAHVGTSRTQAERDTPVIKEIGGIKVGFMNYTCSLNSMNTKGVDPDALKFGINWTKNSDCKVDAQRLRAAGADVIVCYMHWGTEYEGVDNDQTYLAKMLVESGVDVIIGSHPHVVQPAQWLTGTNQFGEAQNTLCLYSLGNFLSDQRLAYRDGGIMFDFTIQEQADGTFEIISPKYLPTWVWRTGNEASGFMYYVVPVGKYLNSRPDGMSDEDYSRMLASYQENVAAMSKGVGAIANP